MPLIQLGEGYRTFSEPSIYEAETEAEVKQVEIPTDKAFAFVAKSDGSASFELWKFDTESTAAAGATILIPDNPLFVDEGRWVKIPTGGGGGGSGLAIIGSASPEGSETADPGQFFWDDVGKALYLKTTGSGDTGWLQLFAF